jgi:hypothetical protein
VSIVVAALVAFILNLLITETFTRRILVPNDTIYQKQIRIEKKLPELRIVSLGDSHVYNGITLDNAKFSNFAIESEPIPVTYFKLKWLSNHAPNLNVILLQYDYHIFSYYRTRDIEHIAWRYKEYINEPVPAELGNYPSDSFQSRFRLMSLQPDYAPIVHKALGKYLTEGLDKPMMLDDGTGVLTKDFSKVDIDERIFAARKRLNAQIAHRYIIHDGLLDYYRKTIAFARNKGLKVVLVRYPASNQYLGLIDEPIESALSAVLSTIMEAEPDLLVLDYRKAFSEKQQYFADEDHLNINGARELGKLISIALSAQGLL